MGSALSLFYSPIQNVGSLATDLARWATTPVNPYRFVPEEEDAYQVQEILLGFSLPLELVQVILDEAEYWPRLICQRESEPHLLQVNTTPENDHFGTRCYLISPKIPEFSKSGKSRILLRRIVFHTFSRDQGWSTSSFPGRYEGSHTWFDAVIFRGLRDNDEENPDRTYRRIKAGTLRNRPGVPSQVLSTYTNSDTWALQKNIRASSSEHLHEIVWDRDDPSPCSASPTEFSEVTGSGLGQGFVRELRPGDNIAVLAKAQYPGWCNHVGGVDMQILYAV
ncbi:hypothetical protein FA15DRAFT_709496 [Coprinopsis marcescibilis]|uniref:Uncharacterized protein n=1 Tax=Coprinopsis marcescibilis TaxID=230819 RepID=A0A5C3KFL1_COPMA|nr:hypothetical protein FA15DRAFT_709496 [Coprinopsis marcescibilis]